MSTKSFTAKIVFKDDKGNYLSNTEAYQQKKALWELHKKFNHYTSIVIQLILGMKNGQFSDKLKQEYMCDKGKNLTKEDLELFKFFYTKVLVGTKSQNIKDYLEPISTNKEAWGNGNVPILEYFWDNTSYSADYLINNSNSVEEQLKVLYTNTKEEAKRLEKKFKVSEADFIKDFYTFVIAKKFQLYKKFFDKDKLMNDLQSDNRRKILSMAWAKIQSNHELYQQWQEKYYTWLYDIINKPQTDDMPEKKKGKGKKKEQKSYSDDAETKLSVEKREEVKQFLKDNTDIRAVLEKRFLEKNTLLSQVFDNFKSTFNPNEKGDIQANRYRWHVYRDWLISVAPELGEKINEEQLPDIQNSDEKSGIATLLDDHKELKKLDREIGRYISTFRLNKRKRHISGYEHPPTFTLPNYLSHPDWCVFQKNDSYDNLDITEGSIKLNIGQGLNKNTKPIYFQSDIRFADFSTVSPPKENGRDKYYYYDNTTQSYADISGAKLVIRMPKGVKSRAITKKDEDDIIRNSEYYLYFTVSFPDDKFIKGKNKEPDEILKNIEEMIQEKPHSIAVDLGQKHLAAITLCEYSRQPNDTYNMEHIPIKYKVQEYSKTQKRMVEKERVNKTGWLANIEGLSFDDIKHHEDELRRLRSEQTKSKNPENTGLQPKEAQKKATRLSSGQRSFAEYSDYVLNMKEDRYKKTAAIIIQTALLNGAKLILMENMRGYSQGLFRSKRDNRNLMRWNHRQIRNWIEQQAKQYGIRVIDVNPYYSSQLCSKCGFNGEHGILGHRFSQLNKEQIEQYREWEKETKEKKKKYQRDIIIEDTIILENKPTERLIEMRQGGDLYCCNKEGHVLNADINGSLNLHRIFLSRGLVHTKLDEIDETDKEILKQKRSKIWENDIKPKVKKHLLKKYGK